MSRASCAVNRVVGLQVKVELMRMCNDLVNHQARTHIRVQERALSVFLEDSVTVVEWIKARVMALSYYNICKLEWHIVRR